VKKLSVFTLMMINVSAILSLRSLPGYAEYGYALITYLSLAALCFFIPSALVAAELASAWKGRGGVYLWVKEAFGPKWGFLAIFMQWVENLPWFPAVLAFAASDVAYVVNPALAESKLFTVGVIIGALWLSTLLNFRDMKFSAFFSSSGAVLGAIIPGVVIIGLGVWGLSTHVDAQLSLTWKALAPDFHNAQQLMLLAAMLVSFQGMEMSAVHVNEVENPGKNYPRAIFAAGAIILVVAILGGMAIAEVVPAKQLSLSAGVCQAFEKLFAIHGTSFLTPIFSFFMGYGALAMVATWMVGPSKGLLEVANEGMLPRSWRTTNKYGMPTGILLIQASLSSLVSLAILFMPTVSSAFMLMIQTSRGARRLSNSRRQGRNLDRLLRGVGDQYFRVRRGVHSSEFRVRRGTQRQYRLCGLFVRGRGGVYAVALVLPRQGLPDLRRHRCERRNGGNWRGRMNHGARIIRNERPDGGRMHKELQNERQYR
jgi:amino acid transporter